MGASESPGSAPAPVTCWVTLRKSHSLSEPPFSLPVLQEWMGGGLRWIAFCVRSVPSPARGHSLVHIGQGCCLRLFLV